MSKVGERLLQSAMEAQAIARGELAPARSYEADDIDVAAIRKRLNLSQDKFAARFGLSVATVRDWEQKRRRPDRTAMILLRVIDQAPETVERAASPTRLPVQPSR